MNMVFQRCMLTAGCLALLVVFTVGLRTVEAQDDPFTTPSASTGDDRDTASEQSFGAAFFVSTRIIPGTGERKIELLGSCIIWLLLGLSVLSLGQIGFMALNNRQRDILPPELHKKVAAFIQDEDYRGALQSTQSDGSYFGQVTHAALSEASHGYTAMITALLDTGESLLAARLRKMEFLNVLGQVSPMIGLFGTVYGMILAFQAIVMSGGNADPVLLAGGIGTALTTTFWGLVVAIPALSGYALVRNRVDGIATDTLESVESMLGDFKSRNHARSSHKRKIDSKLRDHAKTRFQETSTGEEEDPAPGQAPDREVEGDVEPAP